MSQKFRFILLILSAVLSSCAGSAEMRADGSVKFTGPIMARVDRFAVAVKKPDGTTVKIYMVNGNAEAVPIEAFRSAAALGLGMAQSALAKARNAGAELTARQAQAQAAEIARIKATPIITGPDQIVTFPK